MAKNYTIESVPLCKAVSHILKHSKNDCIGLLLGTNGNEGISVTEVVPLFHDRIFASTLESAFMMVQAVYADKEIVGVYDAPLHYKSGEAYPMSPICTNICETIRTNLSVQDVMVLSLRVPKRFGDDSDDDTPVKEVTDEDENLIIQAFTMGPGSTYKKTPKFEHPGFDSTTVQSIIKRRSYTKIVDFDEHLNDDLALDWTNHAFTP